MNNWYVSTIRPTSIVSLNNGPTEPKTPKVPKVTRIVTSKHKISSFSLVYQMMEKYKKAAYELSFLSLCHVKIKLHHTPNHSLLAVIKSLH